MASVYSQAFSSIACKQKLININPNKRCTTFNCIKKEFLNKHSVKRTALSLTTSLGEVVTKSTETRPNIGVQRQVADRYRLGVAIDGGVGYRQTVVIRSSEVGSDKNATIECILNLLQETGINHLRTSGIVGDGFGITPCMLKNNLIWVVTKLTVEIDNYPKWDEVLEIDTWLRPFGKNGVNKDWTIKNLVTGQVCVRATSNWMMMNEKTRRLSKIPNEVRAEISPFFRENKEYEHKKIAKLVDAKYIKGNLKPKKVDIDMNHHVNNVKYANWMLETIPDEVFEENHLSSITLEFKKECGISETIQSLCQPEENNEMSEVRFEKQKGENFLDEYLPYKLDDRAFSYSDLRFTHLLQTMSDHKKDEEIVRGRTTWTRRTT